MVNLFGILLFLLAPGQPTPPKVPPKQVVRPVRHTVGVNPISILLGSYGGYYERVLGRWISLQVHFEYLHYTYEEKGIPAVEVTAGMLVLIPHIYLLGRAPAGPYIAPKARTGVIIGSAEQATTTISGQGYGYSVGGTVGYSFLFLNRLNIKVGGGIEWANISAEGKIINSRTGTSEAQVKFAGKIIPSVDLVFALAF